VRPRVVFRRRRYPQDPDDDILALVWDALIVPWALVWDAFPLCLQLQPRRDLLCGTRSEL